MRSEVEHRFHVVAFELGVTLLHFRQHDLLVELVPLPLVGFTVTGENLCLRNVNIRPLISPTVDTSVKSGFESMQTIMKKQFLQACGLCLLSGAFGCKTNVPMVEHHPGTYQIIVQAAEHWRIMAQELVKRIASDPNFRDKWIYVDAPGEVTPFSEAYRNLVISELTSQSFRVAASPEVAQLKLSVTGQLIWHGNFRFLINPTSFASSIGYELRNFFVGDETGTDWQTGKELVVTARVQEKEALRFSHSQIVYVSPKDAPLYGSEHYQGLTDWQEVEAEGRAARPPQFSR